MNPLYLPALLWRYNLHYQAVLYELNLRHYSCDFFEKALYVMVEWGETTGNSRVPYLRVSCSRLAAFRRGGQHSLLDFKPVTGDDEN